MAAPVLLFRVPFPVGALGALARHEVVISLMLVSVALAFERVVTAQLSAFED
jgi:hypothetical protein